MHINEVSCKNPIFYVLGATGTGKSLAAVKIARVLRDRFDFRHVVIVNCDVMQFYSGLPIATNKVSLAEMEGIPHCFIGFLSSRGVKIRDPAVPYGGGDKEVCETPNDSGEGNVYNIHNYVHDVVEFIEAFFRNNSFAAVVVCGGTCYYAQAIMFRNVLTDEDDEGFAPSETDRNFSLSVECAEGNSLWNELNRVDPVVAVRYHPNDTRRIARLLEIYKKTNRLPSEIYASRSNPCFRFCPSRCFFLWTHVAHEKLIKTLEARVDKMVGNGIVDEFVELAKQQLLGGFDFPLTNAIGFKEFFSAFDITGADVRMRGVQELNNSIEILKGNTKRYAKQQVRWIKNRFLGRLRYVFTSQEEWKNFVCVDASKPMLDFIETIECATEFLIKPGSQPAAGMSFPLTERGVQPSAVQHEWCPDCELFVRGGDQMEVHLASKRHRGAVKHAALVKVQREEYGRIIPQKKTRLPQV